MFRIPSDDDDDDSLQPLREVQSDPNYNFRTDPKYLELIKNNPIRRPLREVDPMYKALLNEYKLLIDRYQSDLSRGGFDADTIKQYATSYNEIVYNSIIADANVAFTLGDIQSLGTDYMKYMPQKVLDYYGIKPNAGGTRHRRSNRRRSKRRVKRGSKRRRRR